MVQNDGTKPWIWVRGHAPTEKDRGEEGALVEASKILKEVTDKVEDIKNDPSIPLRSNKKTGAKSKKEVREQVQAEAAEKRKEVAIRHGYISGKWSSLVSGPLASTSAYLAKVATSPEQDNPNYQHVICVYIPDVYDKDKVTEVMKVLLRNHGLSLSGVKSDMYTMLGINSKHASGLPSTELRDAFFLDLASNKHTPADKSRATAEGSATLPPVVTGKPKLKLKKKSTDDPFASDNDEKPDQEEETGKKELQSKTAKGKPVPKRKTVDSPFASDEEDGDDAKLPERGALKKPNVISGSKRKKPNDDDDEEQPNKRRSRRTNSK
ncbi:hypothetical protein H0H81_010931 [Sphagnurus paluster]|uniref:Uncharacterized protein n=1 Tax=Sphagnurus paluster TaxID=117069 RepID=A0A9P7KIG0_9AGAR|nr:hypothetical protein H0H81_010931 [Sphagnurus paluster]